MSRMKQEDKRTMAIIAAAEEARRFLARVDAHLERNPFTYPITGTPESGALQRSSMDLTRALAAVRRTS